MPSGSHTITISALSFSDSWIADTLYFSCSSSAAVERRPGAVGATPLAMPSSLVSGWVGGGATAQRSLKD
jgi:hypothetical protein